MREYAILLFAVACLAVFCGCTATTSGPEEITPTMPVITSSPVPAGPAETVFLKARSFDPMQLTITKGTTVTWINKDTKRRYVVHMPGANSAKLFDSGPLEVEESYSYTFQDVGRYSYGDPQIGGGRSPLIIVEAPKV
jgi:plastocyanin